LLPKGDEEAGGIAPENAFYGSVETHTHDDPETTWKHEKERHRSAIHMNEFRVIPHIAFLELPIQNMLQVTAPDMVKDLVGAILCNIILAQVLIAGWTYGFFGKDITKTPFYTKEVSDVTAGFTVAAFFTLVLAIFLNIVLYSESAKWTRQTDIKWFLLRYRWWFLVPVNIGFLGIFCMMASLCGMIYMHHGDVMMWCAIASSTVFLICASAFYGWLELSASHHIDDTINSMHEALKLFQLVDVDNNGTITAEELHAALQNPAIYQNLGVPLDKIHLAFTQISGGGDRITWNQFVDFFAPTKDSAGGAPGSPPPTRTFLAAAGFMR
jgi:hypothetical protein